MKIGTRLCVLRCHPNWQNKFARLCDVLSYVPHCNGCAPSAATCFRFRAALISPFTLRLSAAISPSATLWKTTCKVTTLTRRFSMMCKLYRAFCNLSIVFSNFLRKKFSARNFPPMFTIVFLCDIMYAQKCFLRESIYEKNGISPSGAWKKKLGKSLRRMGIWFRFRKVGKRAQHSWKGMVWR